MDTVTARVCRHEAIAGDYRILALHAPAAAARARPGQFVHLQIPRLGDAILRRPFSIYRAENETLSILYKPVGKGTRAMVDIRADESVSLLGPLGNGFPVDRPVAHPVLVAGGYGMAALYMVAAALPHRGVICMGGASARDILCVDDFIALGWEVLIATMDGTRGTRGLVTDVLDPYLRARRDTAGVEFFACGPNGMLKAVCARARESGRPAWLSMDRHMGCGVGACLVCVQKVRAPDDDVNTWRWARVCTEGPVFEAREIVWDEHE